MTDNGACDRAEAFARALLESRHPFIYAREWVPEEERAAALEILEHSAQLPSTKCAADGQPPASRVRA